MKKLLLKFTAFLLLLTSIASSCNPECPPDCPDEYPKEISFTEYSLQGTTCQWQNLPYDEKVIMINSSEELKKYITCTEDAYPAVDFSKHTLLLLSGKNNHSICEITAKKIQQFSSDKYELNIEITLNDAVGIEEWAAAFIVKKLKEGNNIELKVITEMIETKIILPVVVTDQRIIDFFNECRFTGKSVNHPSSCFFTTLGSYEDTCLIINTIEEFRHVYECSGKLPEIDFDIYTLIIGKKVSGWHNRYVFDQKFIKNCTLTFYLELDWPLPSGDGEYIICHWGIYPKLPNKSFYVEYKYLWL